MRFLTLTLLFIAVVGLHGQPVLDPMVKDRLVRLFPDANSFTPKEGSPPHFKAYVDDPDFGQPTLVGYAFWTTELEPLERGYDGPIQILVGVDLNGILTDIIVVAPYNAQVNALQDALPTGIRVGTVDKFQGQEAPVCLVSMTASSAEETTRGMEFLFSLNRINVAVSRAKALALVFGAPRLREAKCNTIEQMQLVNTLCALPEII